MSKPLAIVAGLLVVAAIVGLVWLGRWAAKKEWEEAPGKLQLAQEAVRRGEAEVAWALLGEAYGRGVLADVRTRDLIAQIQHHLGDAVHPGTADTDEVQVPHATHGLGGIAGLVHRQVAHAATSMHTPATVCVALRRARR